jgi:hypothetical protein
VSASPPAATLPDDALAELQAAMLHSALHATPLAGGAPLSLPDRAFLPRGGPAPLADENLSPELERRLPPGVRVIAAADLRAAAPAGHDVAYLRFGRPTADDEGTVWIALELHLASQARAVSTSLGGVQVGVRDVDGRWRITEAPRSYAT